MSAETLLQRLDKVKQTGPDKWLACCPAHEDKRPSLAIRELDDGTILLHCFGGCSTPEVLESIGLDFAELYPPKTKNYFSPEDYTPTKVRKPWNASDILQALAYEALLIQVFANSLANGDHLTDSERDRLRLSVTRMQRGAEVANGF